MKVSKFANLMAVGLALTLVGSGCKHAPVGVTHIPGRPTTGVPTDFNTPPITGDDSKPITDTDFKRGQDGIHQPDPQHIGWIHDENALAAHIVHFAYDSSVIKASEQPNVAAVADYLKSNSSKAVEVDGHCDERGTDEYNRALGERRALAIREALVALGIDAGRVDTKSYGRDKPIDLGHSEAAHAKNRRGEFILLTPP
jgi:peptidoglycan-associated lipoprotein